MVVVLHTSLMVLVVSMLLLLLIKTTLNLCDLRLHNAWELIPRISKIIIFLQPAQLPSYYHIKQFIVDQITVMPILEKIL